jgi:hypothetical protein
MGRGPSESNSDVEEPPSNPDTRGVFGSEAEDQE